VTTRVPSPSRTPPRPGPPPGSPRPLLVPSLVFPGVAVVGRPPTTQDRPRCPYSKCECSIPFEAVLSSEARKRRGPKPPNPSASHQAAHRRLVSVRRYRGKRASAGGLQLRYLLVRRPGFDLALLEEGDGLLVKLPPSYGRTGRPGSPCPCRSGSPAASPSLGYVLKFRLPCTQYGKVK